MRAHDALVLCPFVGNAVPLTPIRKEGRVEKQRALFNDNNSDDNDE